VKYVITLDADTQLPRDTARQLVGAMTHPLNRAEYDERKQRVTHGYGILQPRVAASISGAHRSRYARLWTSEPGIDPYTRVVSDVYQTCSARAPSSVRASTTWMHSSWRWAAASLRTGSSAMT